MNDTAIRIENIGKQYRIGRYRQRHDTMRDLIGDAVRSSLDSFLRNGARRNEPSEDVIWALRNVSVDIGRGEVVGIIGRNGAGKSTLLKILSRITEPTEGRVLMNGRIASLLEVGTGFHPELTGRENIYLSGAILGMTKAEIRTRFDDIVAFSEIDKFLDTPVKRYSSGMYVRLAFAVAAHLEPEILLVDEVLAVGDAAFQKKCLGKMGDVAKEGRTVLFVSHNMASISALCDRVILMSDGQIELDASANDAISAYLSLLKTNSQTNLQARSDRDGDQSVRYTDIWFEDNQGRRISKGITGQPLSICLRYTTTSSLTTPYLDFSVAVFDGLGHHVTYCCTKYSYSDPNVRPSNGIVTCSFDRLPLTPGSYRLNVAILYLDAPVDHVEGACTLEVDPGDFYGTGKIPSSPNWKILVDHSWTLREEQP